ncbi:hypothetical protein GOB86_00705 [Acetobacter lambici]|uniref:Outer membrane lipoprotein carrier protein LolA n=1 Tax=Acetobacter lambici TaxID=1332824 RepID=A0ABT1EVY2_9PROT|nr:hypothetical protein [Acetobacter lambici]MCP1241217.1 hypothetical protein [Acetobacter lambici]MCP1257112.1 hypothetical protein [Acetobacter lambici]NHO55605.1 hypothetical protein [Acetobacter lambici]
MSGRAFSRRGLFALAPLFLAACATTQQGAGRPQSATVNRVESYFRTVNLQDAPFTQIWPNGASGNGLITYRPGYLDMRFTAPHDMELKASGRSAVFTDARNGSETHIGLGHSPLGLLLGNPVRLSGPVMVTDVQQPPGLVQISLTRADNPSQGLITLRFRDERGVLSLYDVRILDAERKLTQIRLDPA